MFALMRKFTMCHSCVHSYRTQTVSRLKQDVAELFRPLGGVASMCDVHDDDALTGCELEKNTSTG